MERSRRKPSRNQCSVKDGRRTAGGGGRCGFRGPWKRPRPTLEKQGRDVRKVSAQSQICFYCATKGTPRNCYDILFSLLILVICIFINVARALLIFAKKQLLNFLIVFLLCHVFFLLLLFKKIISFLFI